MPVREKQFDTEGTWENATYTYNYCMLICRNRSRTLLDGKKIASHYNAYTPFSVIQTVEPGLHELYGSYNKWYTCVQH